MKLKSFIALCLMASFILLSSFYWFDKATEGFSVHQITSTLSPDLAYSLPPISAVKAEEIRKLLPMPFTYLGKGCQTYVFLSQDKEYVIKFFKHKHLRPNDWLDRLPLPARWKSPLQEKIAARKIRIHNLFSSVQLGSLYLQEETGIVHAHLDQSSEFGLNVVLVDKLGLKHSIFIDDFDYVIQKRADRLSDVFAQLQPTQQSFNPKLQQLIALTEHLCQKGIRDRDRAFAQNVGFAIDGTHAVCLDVGQFYVDDSAKSEEETRKEVLRRLEGLAFWMQKHTPQLLPLAQEEISKREAPHG